MCVWEGGDGWFLGKQPTMVQRFQKHVAASQGQYYVTGKLTDAVYAEDCTFTDPTTNVSCGAVHLHYIPFSRAVT